MTEAQKPFRVESASERAKKMGITTWTKFHYASQPEQSIFTPLDAWGHSIRQPYYGPIIESHQQYFLAVGWETEEQWDKFKSSPEHQQLMANLTTNNVQPETEIIIFTSNMFAIGYTSNVELFIVYWPASITQEVQTAIWKTKQLVHTAASGMPNPLCYRKKPMFGWIDGQKDWNGESAVASVWAHKWQNQELEQKYKTNEKRLVWGDDGRRSYPLAVEAFQHDLKSLGAIGWDTFPNIAVNRFPTDGSHGIFISAGWATPPLWNSMDERCKPKSDFLLADSYHNRATVSGALFQLAVHHAWMNIVKLAISADKSFLNWVDPISGSTALHISVESAHVDVIKTLLDAEADPNLKDGASLLPFAKAMRSNNLDIARMLLDSSKDIMIDEPDKAGVTPFLRACLDGEKAVPVIRELLEKAKDKVNLNVRLPRDVKVNECGRTALIMAPFLDPEQEGSDSLFNLLLEHGADPNVPCTKHEFNAGPNLASKRGFTPLSRAAWNGHALAVRKLLDSNGDPNQQNYEGETALHSCSAGGHVSCIEELVTYGTSLSSLMYPDLGEPYVIGFTPLVLAIACYRQSSVEKLLTFDPGPGQALHMALASEELRIAKAVFERYPQPNLYDEDLGTPLHLVVMSNNEEIFDFILAQKGIDVNIPGPSGRTPLSYAAMRYQGFVEKLIQAHADPNIKDHEGKTALDHVIAEKDWEMAQILCRHTRLDLVQGSVRRQSALYGACQTGQKDVFKVINASCQNLNHSQYIELCELALHAAFAAGNEEFFEQLINVPGVTGSVEDEDGWTPLKYATVYNQSEIKKKILKRFQQNGMDRVDQRGKRVTKMPQRWHKNDRHPALYEKDDNADPREIMITTTLNDAYPDGKDRYAVARADHPIPTDENYCFEISIKKGCSDEQHDVDIGLIDGTKMSNGQRSLARALTYCYESLGGSTYDDMANSLKSDCGLSREYREGYTVGCGFDAAKECVYFTWQ
ncbi:ankyrin repeat-containing protein [Fusarium subglutinans]|uniref:Ankyrin repeat-containing protein n=1 Tax=Gibberella subglutinans TaxID=42677 RepID=A0A8H5Q0U7_GIBSU|nr:ankyrin repeat-containing protein [Fusarium subglutinans]KAF5606149.1 ankyrin repeat-containing protein [Fusarium subglutinans]